MSLLLASHFIGSMAPVLPFTNNNRTYELQMAQNPIRARMCGFGEKDKRPMDPPPIVRLIVKNEDGTKAQVSQMDVNFYIVIADIYSADKSTPCTLVANPLPAPQHPLSNKAMEDISLNSGTSTSSPSPSPNPATPTSSSSNNYIPTSSRNLTGSTVASGNILTNLENETGIYFVFHDISVRSEGVYTLKFSFIHTPNPDGPTQPIQASVFSEPFTTYSSKRFPGMSVSTPLSKCFAKQGIKIPIRKETRPSKKWMVEQSSSGGGEQDSEELEDD